MSSPLPPVGGCQRWRDGRSIFRPSDEPFGPYGWEVGEIAGDREAKAFVCQHHYSRSYPAARFRFGLYHRGQLVGVAVFSHPCSSEVLTSVFPGKPTDSVELGRFVLLDEAPSNSESWFLTRCFELLRGQLAGVVSFSDPLPRTTKDGSLVFPGHLGVIYQAANAVYLGRGTARTLRLFQTDGRVLSARSLQKIRRRERGWEYAAALLEHAGAEPLRGDPYAWLATWLPRLTRTVRHPGNHKYAWPLWRPVRHFLPPSLPYPKTKEAAA